ncbi:Lar family restriction alleviation protein [Aurantiacibacter spongiae]|uniref:Restriction alleviation protein, Lar family n=1 Tax=Aurantiacibacter spongiae TaxID=2488860 RepID=A0A3N5CNG4_9SPHN|nr:Lar family restriction alleviation protein [Aurantiacibacter spongiae]RPF70474.1 hypothetical protein EG799_01640 [Aurantiacibacter spongiae]
MTQPTNTTDSALVACPFCETEFPPVVAADDNGDCVICTGCSALGPSRQTREEAITAWNTRTTTDATERSSENARLRSGVIGDVLAEVEKAVAKFPTWPTRIIDAGNVVTEEAGELAKACLQVTYEPHKETLEGVRMEAIQTAAMCLRFLASIDRYNCSPAEQHEQPVSALFARAALEPSTSTEGERA